MANDWRKAWRSKARQGAKRSTGKAKAKPQGAHTFVVQKPFCSPARDGIYTALESYGVPILKYSERNSMISLSSYTKMAHIELRTFENLKYGPAAILYLPKAIEARVTVPAAQAEWAEYLIERTMRFAVVGGRIEKRNREWADQHGGKMPAPWDARASIASARQRSGGIAPPPDGEPWIETSCKSGRAVWDAVMDAAKRGNHGK